MFVVVAAKTTPLNDKTPGLFWSGVRFPPGLAPAKPSLRLGRVWVGVRCGGGTADALKRQNPWPFFGQGFVFRRGLPRLSPPYGQGGFGWVFVVVAAKTTPLNDKTPGLFWSGVRLRAAATYSPTWSGSTIGTNAFNFSVRNGKRWVHVVIATIVLLHYRLLFCVFHLSPNGHIPLYAHILPQAQPCLKACSAAISIPD